MHVAIVPGQLDHAALGRERAAQDGEPARRLERLADLAHHRQPRGVPGRRDGARLLVERSPGHRRHVAHQVRVELKVKIQPSVRLRRVDGPGHQNVGRIMVAFRLDQAPIERRQFGIERLKFAGEDLKLLATAPFDE